MHIISNSLLCDERGVAIGFSEPLIHTFNKHHVTEFFKEDFKETVVSIYSLVALCYGRGKRDKAQGSGLFATGGGGGTEPRGVACLLRDGGRDGPRGVACLLWEGEEGRGNYMYALSHPLYTCLAYPQTAPNITFYRVQSTY